MRDLPVVNNFLLRTRDSIEEVKKNIDNVLDISIIDETLNQYQRILDAVNTYEKMLRTELELFNDGMVKNPYRTKNEMFQTISTLLALKIDLVNLLLKLRKKREDSSMAFNLNINFRSQEYEKDYIIDMEKDDDE